MMRKSWESHAKIIHVQYPRVYQMPMTRLLLRFTLGLMIVLGSATIAVHALVAPDWNVLNMLLPPDCAAPCFLGVRPGQTTLRQAIPLLNHHPYISGLRGEQSSTGAYTTYRIRWSGQQPDWIDTRWGTVRVLVQTEPEVSDDVVYSALIRSNTRLSLAHFYAALGQPDMIQVRESRQNPGLSYLRIQHLYPSYGLILTTDTPCPTRFDALLDAPVSLAVTSKVVAATDALSIQRLSEIYRHDLCAG